MTKNTKFTENDFTGNFPQDWDRTTPPPECPYCTGHQWNGLESHLPDCGTKCPQCQTDYVFRLGNTRDNRGEWLFQKECDCPGL